MELARDPIDLLPVEAKAHLRTAYLPETEPGGIGRSSGFGGQAHLPDGVEHPICPNCQRPIQLLAQLALDDLPPDARPQGEGLLQLFYCSQAPDGSDMPCEVTLDADIPRSGEKLGGWPRWIQGIDYPTCPRCSKQMELVLQIGSEQNLQVMFGDVGIGHVTQGRDHSDVLAFAWACN